MDGGALQDATDDYRRSRDVATKGPGFDSIKDDPTSQVIPARPAGIPSVRKN
jgi:hypothetical protein